MSKTATRTLPDSPAGLAESVTILRTGGLVAFPTETVYGLGADARNSQAVRRIFTVKKRSPSNPLIVLVQDLATARRLVDLNEQAERLAAAFWPGALTLVLPLKDDAGLSPLLGGDRQTLGVRLPGNSVAARLLTAFGGPIAAPSANLSGMTSPTHAQHVLDQLGGRIDAVVDGGVSQAGVESTIIGLDGPAVLHRPGAIPTEAIEACLGAQLPPVAARCAARLWPPTSTERDRATTRRAAAWVWRCRRRRRQLVARRRSGRGGRQPVSRPKQA